MTASNDGTARIWRTDRTLEATLRGHAAAVLSAVFSPSEDRVLTASVDGTARTWLADSQVLIRVADSRATRSFTPDELLNYEKLLAVPASKAQELVQGLFDKLVLKKRVISHLRDSTDVDDELREVALIFAEGRSESSPEVEEQR